jgi:hypothetical protein
MMALLVRIVFDGEQARFLGTLVTVKCASNDHFVCFFAEHTYTMVASLSHELRLYRCLYSKFPIYSQKALSNIHVVENFAKRYASLLSTTIN